MRGMLGQVVCRTMSPALQPLQSNGSSWHTLLPAASLEVLSSVVLISPFRLALSSGSVTWMLSCNADHQGPGIGAGTDHVWA